MREDMYRLRHRKQRRRRILAVTILCMLAALVAVSMKKCGEDLQEKLNENYVPMDDIRKDFETYNKLKESGMLQPKR